MTGPTVTNQRRVYTLEEMDLTQEQTAVVFAMTSRSPDAFDDIAHRVVEQASAADFHERWVVGYGHSSVAEHAVLHLAIENISRLTCDTLEDNRLASYTEKSSRYQVIQQGSFHIPQELDQHTDLRTKYIQACHTLFQAYESGVKNSIQHLEASTPQVEQESARARRLRIRRTVTDSVRALLPAATLTNVGLTANARTMEHTISKLLSAPLREEKELGEELRQKALEVTPTLVKYAAFNPYMHHVQQQQQPAQPASQTHPGVPGATLLEYDPNAERTLATALLYTSASTPWPKVQQKVREMPIDLVRDTIDRFLDPLGDHDAPARELEHVTYLIELVMDYGAYREFKRHRMQTTTSQHPHPGTGYSIPPLITQAGIEPEFTAAVQQAQETCTAIHEAGLPQVAPYALTHAHHRRVLLRVNLRQCYHLMKLRTSPQAHPSIRQPIQQALEQLRDIHPTLFRHLRLRS